MGDWTAALLGAAALLFCAAGCDDGPPKDPGPRPPAPDTAALSAALAHSSAAMAPSASAAPPGAGAQASLAGTWEGRYDAKKGSVVLPDRVKDKTWNKDDGKAATGPGTVTLTVSATGEISGTGKGALGPVSLSGKVDGSMIRASVMPVDPTANGAMTGVLVGDSKDGAIVGELRVAGPDASVVRESPIRLERK